MLLTAFSVVLEMCIDKKQHIAVVSATDPSVSYRVLLPSTDIDAFVGFSNLHFFLCVCSLVLACSDIPRTGLGVRHLSDIVTSKTPLTPDTGFYYGPYDYPVASIVKSQRTSNMSELKESQEPSLLTQPKCGLTSLTACQFNCEHLYRNCAFNRLGPPACYTSKGVQPRYCVSKRRLSCWILSMVHLSTSFSHLRRPPRLQCLSLCW